MYRQLCVAMFAIVAGSALAANPPPVVESDTQYHYGMQLDIAEVLSVRGTPEAQALYPVTMVYVDQQGQTQRLSYIVTDTSWGGQQ